MVNSVMSASAPVAVIDLGSNSVLLLVLGRGDRVLRDEARITRLGRGVFQSGVLAPDALKDLLIVFQGRGSFAPETSFKLTKISTFKARFEIP